MIAQRIIPPGGRIGILGGGQLGRMTALAAAKLGYRAHIYCQSADEPAAQVAYRTTLGAFDDRVALQDFARQVDVATPEWENIPAAALAAVAAHTSVYPDAAILAVAQDRVQEKDCMRSLGLGTAYYRPIADYSALAAIMPALQAPAILKAQRLGYDGKGQVRIMPGDDPREAWTKIGGVPAILEDVVDFVCEASVIVARRGDGAAVAFPIVRNIHENGILATTHVPAGLRDAIQDEAKAAALRLATALDVIGLLAVEMFVLQQPNAEGQNVLMNEVAPRPHNSGHWTLDACATSQFEQLIRAICGLPLGATTILRPVVMTNLLGDDAQDWQRWLTVPDAQLHLYGKTESRPGRKMGHVTVG